MIDTDLELLARYARHHAEDAFAEIVRRHLDLVHSAAFRQVRSPQLAEEVAQSTFIKLARQARRLAPDTILTAWLYQVTRREAIDVVRREARRQLREQTASEMNAMNDTDADWMQIEPLLDEAMHALDDIGRAAVLLRYFENKSLREVGAALGTTDDAARKRVNRAIECLREFFAKRGVTVGASGLGVIIAANAVQSAPVGLALTISTAAAALAGTTIIATATKAIAMTALQKALIAVTIVAAGAIVPFAIQHLSDTKLRQRDEVLFRQNARLAELTTENERLSNLVSQAKSSESLSDAERFELLGLRTEVTGLREQMNKAGNTREATALNPEQQAALAKLRSSTSSDEASTAFNTLRQWAPMFGAVYELAEIMKANSYAARAIAHGDGLVVIAGGDNAKVNGAFRPLLADSNPAVRQSAAYVLAQALTFQSGPDVIRVAIEGLNSGDEDLLVSGISTLSNAGQDRSERRGRPTRASLGAAAEDATAALLNIAKNSPRQDLRDSAMRLLDGLNPDLSQTDPAMQASFKENQQISAFTERLNTGQATLSEIIAGLQQYPKSAPAAANALVQLGPEAQSALPALREALAALTPSTNATAADRGQAFRAREQIANAMQRIAPDQPKALFTRTDMRALMEILQAPEIRADAERRQRIYAVRQMALAEAPGGGIEVTPEQMRRLLDGLKGADQPTYDALAEQVRTIDPNFFPQPDP